MAKHRDASLYPSVSHATPGDGTLHTSSLMTIVTECLIYFNCTCEVLGPRVPVCGEKVQPLEVGEMNGYH